jgi:hypothetical protein
MMVGGVIMNGKNLILSVLALAVGCLVATSMLMPSLAPAQTDQVKTSMAALKAEIGELGAPNLR